MIQPSAAARSVASHFSRRGPSPSKASWSSSLSAKVVETSSDGARVSIMFGNDDRGGSIVHYDASWLRANDPRRVVLPSGQRGGGGAWI
ncbi:hypothetical protein ACHAXA_008121 [Cyclostephanos tholiformis]|uniref:Uncharacterized protein n=1 Tax=Cyclostephanos tholiformis TaxID=382380 RepID=A0ABD3SEK0_9STRA